MQATNAGEGTAMLSSSRFVVQTKETVDWVYVVGASGLTVGDQIRVEDPLLHGMRWSKWGATFVDAAECSPLSTGQEASGGLVTASTDGGATLSISRNVNSEDIHAYAYTEVVVESGALGPGDEIRVRYGDTSGGADCGHQMPDRSFQNVRWVGYERLGDATEFAELVPAPTFDVESTGTANTLLVVVPSYAQSGDVEVHVAFLDRLGNPVPGVVGTTVEVEGQTHVMAVEDEGVTGFTVDLSAGVHRLDVTAGALTGTSNPVVVTEDAPERNLYWGDIHVHHGHSYPDGTGGRVNENHTYARDVIALDVVSESMKLAPIEIDGDALWEDLQEDCVTFTSDDYLVLLGFEWMGTMVASGQGHHNLYFDACEVEIPSHATLGPLADDDGVYDWMSTLEADAGTRSVAIPHASIYTGFNWEDRNDELRSVVEVYSEWGNSIDTSGPGGVVDALNSGFRLGFIAASDNHDGWMGNPFSEKDDKSGLAAFWAPDLSRSAIWESLQGKQTYGTTGERIIVDWWIEDQGEVVLPGREVALVSPTVHWEVHGTAPIQSLQVVRVEDAEDAALEELLGEAPNELDVTGSMGLEVTEATHAVWINVVQTGNERAWSTPIWVTLDPSGGDSDPPDSQPDSEPDSEVDSPVDTGDEGPRSRCNEGCATGGAGPWVLALVLLARRRG